MKVLYQVVLLLFFSVATTNAGCAQDSITVKGQFKGNTKYAKVLMKKYDAGVFPIGAAKIDRDSFTLILPHDIEPGIYRFVYAQAEGEKYLDVVINGKEKAITFTINANEENAAPVFTASDENQKWYKYKSETDAQFLRIDLLNQFINAYPNTNSKIVSAALEEWKEEKELYWKNFEAYKNSMKGTLAYEMVINRPYYFTTPTEDPRIQDYEKREHFWDGFNTNNPQLINTPLYTEHILNYLLYWMNPNMNFSAEEKTNGFKQSVDIVIRNFSGNDKTLEFAYKYLTLGFKEIGEEEVLQYLDENYNDLANRCFDAIEKTEFDKRMEGYLAMKVGNAAPDFELKLSENKNAAKSLYHLNSKKTLVVFWSSTCPHCIEEMPKLNEFALNHKEIQIVAVSLDTDPTLNLESIKQFPNMLHTCDFKGWETEAATNYYIAATPTFILLDGDKKILGKYSDFKTIEKSN